jgi:hypothetical protein
MRPAPEAFATSKAASSPPTNDNEQHQEDAETLLAALLHDGGVRLDALGLPRI